MEVHPGPLATPLRNHQKLRRNTESNPAEKQKIFINLTHINLPTMIPEN